MKSRYSLPFFGALVRSEMLTYFPSGYRLKVNTIWVPLEIYQNLSILFFFNEIWSASKKVMTKNFNVFMKNGTFKTKILKIGLFKLVLLVSIDGRDPVVIQLKYHLLLSLEPRGHDP